VKPAADSKPKSQPRTAPCSAACPAGIDVPRYLRQIAAGRFSEALATIRERIPFPMVCGYACVHPCEAKCGRSQFDQAVAIRMLKRAAAELAAGEPLLTALPKTGKKAAIIGSGPCGLTAGYYLALLGHEVTVFEAQDKSGGMLRYGIPGYRLPDEVVDVDIRLIEASGVKILTGRRVVSAESLLDEGYHAVFLASGAWRPARMGIPGEDRPGVLKGIAFLAAVNADNAPTIGARVVVIGGGDTAIDAARVSRRLGAEVTQIYRRTRAEMPASAEEIEAAIEEGVKLQFLTAPFRIDPGAVSCIRMTLGAADASGRPRPEPLAGSEFSIAADTVIMAIGQEVEPPAQAVARAMNGTVRADPQSLATSVPGIYAGGDAVSGPATIIDAIAQGRRASAAIDRFLGGSGDLERFAREQPPAEEHIAASRGSARKAWHNLPPASRLSGFELVEHGYTGDAAREEASRCLSCDLRAFDVQVDAALCKDCGYCKEVCTLGVFERSEDFNASGYRPYLATRAENCIGCLRCLYICPDFAITVSDKREALAPEAIAAMP
jgi:NADPH-dependent glutamate synthase beta subunit-like oxidoreductase/NAD-dependent dihydropyrimidine dehydrogenase PreA subunit